MRFVILCALVLAAASGWAADQANEVDSAAAETEETTATALERLTEARKAFEEALRHVASIEYHEVFDNGAMLGVVIRGQEDEGVQVVGVTPDSGAEAAGILVDDLIVAINDQALNDEAHPARLLRKTMDHVDPGDAVRIVLIRDGEERNVDVEAMRRPHAAGPFHWRHDDGDFSAFPPRGKHVRAFRDHAAAAARRKGGLELVDIGEDLGSYFGVDAGVLVLDAPPGSALKPGDIVRRINDADVDNAKEGYRLLADLDGAGEATVRRENRSRTVAVAPLESFFKRAYKIMLDGSAGEEKKKEEAEIEVEVEVE